MRVNNNSDDKTIQPKETKPYNEFLKLPEESIITGNIGRQLMYTNENNKLKQPIFAFDSAEELRKNKKQ